MRIRHGITRQFDGTYMAAARDQDGSWMTTKWPTAEEAIRSYRVMIAVGPDARPEDVAVPTIVDLASWPEVTLKFPRPAGVLLRYHEDDLDRALLLAIRNAGAGPGRRYELRIELVEVAGDPPFVGEHI